MYEKSSHEFVYSQSHKFFFIMIFVISPLKNIFKKKLSTILLYAEQLPIPDGFADRDININAPRLFTDIFSIIYENIVGKLITAAFGQVSLKSLF